MSVPVVERTRFKVGKYDVVAQPMPHSAHMLRYTVFVGGNRVGALVSLPTESDCLFLEKPPVVPPLRKYQLRKGAGRPKKGSRPPAHFDAPQSHPRDAIPSDVSIAGLPGREDA